MYARYLAGLTTVLDSETVYASMKKTLEKMGVVMLPMEEAFQRYPELVKKYFSRIYSPYEHRFAALHYALWIGGVFVYVPPGVRVPYPIEAFFYVGRELEGQFECTLVVADEGAELTFIEGCSAPRVQEVQFPRRHGRDICSSRRLAKLRHGAELEQEHKQAGGSGGKCLHRVA